MSVAGSDYGGSSYGRSEPRPEKALVVKFTHEERGSKKITYASSKLCSYDHLRKQVRILGVYNSLGCGRRMHREHVW